MNTKTMRLPPRRVLTASNNTNNKRKERDVGFDTLTPSTPTKLLKPTHVATQAGSEKSSYQPASSNQLLAGYLAHEFLTKGTLFGQPWDPARAEALPLESTREPVKPPSQQAAEPVAEERKNHRQRYVEVSSLLKTDGAHFPGIVNPTQLARFLQM